MSTTALQVAFAADGSAEGTIDDIRPSFARHETFHPRFGWLKKGFDAASKHSDVFLRDDATVMLGVGKNMVRAIRYWCIAFKVLEERANPDRPRLRDALPTDFGRQLLSSRSGWDPYLEAPASLWLLHWKLLSPPCRAPAWYGTFNRFRAIEFSDVELLEELRRFRDAHGWEAIVDSSLRKDVHCLLRMYAGGRLARSTLEETLDSPFVELDIIRGVVGSGAAYRFNMGEKSSLPDALVAYACADFAAQTMDGAGTLSVRRLAYEPGSPGAVFKLTESAIAGALERHLDDTSDMRLIDSLGILQIALERAPAAIASAALNSLYVDSRSLT